MVHELKLLRLDAFDFARRFRQEHGGWTYDPSLGKSRGRPVSAKEMRDATKEFEALFASQDRLVNIAKKLFVPALFIVPIPLAITLNRSIAIEVMVALFGAMLAIVALANWRLYRFSRIFWRNVEARLPTEILSFNEQIKLGYRWSWFDRIFVSAAITLFAPVYLFAHGKHDILISIPMFGRQISYVYWVLMKLTLAGFALFVTFLIVRKVIARVRLSQSSAKLRLNEKTRSAFSSGDTKSKGGTMRGNDRADLSGVEKMRRS